MMARILTSLLLFVLAQVAQAQTRVRPQEPQKPYPYEEREVRYENQKAGVQLAGTLSLPRSTAPHPVVILISGSGPQDRDETVAGHKPFLILSDYLTRRGVAVLRLDDRGVGGSTGSVFDSTGDDSADDVLAGIEFLKTQSDINAKRIGLIGHSEGGMIAPVVAAKSSDVAFIVLMAGPGLGGEDILYLQSTALMRAAGMSDARIAQNRVAQEKIFDVVKSERDPEKRAARFREVRDELTAKLDDSLKAAQSQQLEANFRQVSTRWFEYFLSFDPRQPLAKVKCPVLALNGEKDLQVPHKENLEGIESALKSGGNRDYTVKHFPNLNHLFQTSQTGLPSEYAQIEETMAPQVLETISEWIQIHVR